MKLCDSCDKECGRDRAQIRTCYQRLKHGRQLEKVVKNAIEIRKDAKTGWYDVVFANGSVFHCRGPLVDECLKIQGRAVEI